MLTIVEPKEHIDMLWGKQQIKPDHVYRLMRYILRVDHESKILLHNIVTGKLVVLSEQEAKAVRDLPAAYNEALEQLVEDHFLVPEEYNEHQQVVSLRGILRSLYEQKDKAGITQFTILPTTACNARCYYCFEHGIKPLTMTEQTADDVVQFIGKNCGSNKDISITWFGGEPTLAPDRIDRICSGLDAKQIHYTSKMTTNGYLLDERMVSRAKNQWNLKSVNISMDGTEEKYNRIKSYVNPHANPYQQVLKNIGSLLENGIHVNARMNFDIDNYHDFKDLVRELSNRFENNPNLNLNAHQINGCFRGKPHGDERWFSEKIVELNEIARDAGLYRSSDTLPSLVSVGCKACVNSTVTITAEGNLVRCPEQLGDDQITGNVKDGITNWRLLQSWKLLRDDEMCRECCFFPRCLRVKNCGVKQRCGYRLEYKRLYMKTIMTRFNNFQQGSFR